MRPLRSLLVLSLGLALGVIGTGCASATDDVEQGSSDLTQALHEPQGTERKAIFDGMRAELSADFHGQTLAFNATDPAGRFFAHGDWAYFEGIIEGPNSNTQPIDY